MFTGIIQGQGVIERLTRQAGQCRLTIAPRFDFPDIVDGESIAVNGTCLSVEHHEGSVFSLYASRETMNRTTLGKLHEGSLVNLERALAVGDRLGGHIVAGHVDCLATVESITRSGDSLVCRLGFPEAFGPEVVPKGSVALDGISLTINECGRDFLTVNIIPDTQERTTMRLWRPGVSVNMETDIIGKYVRRQLPGSRDGASGSAKGAAASSAGITRDFLLGNGFF